MILQSFMNNVYIALKHLLHSTKYNNIMALCISKLDYNPSSSVLSVDINLAGMGIPTPAECNKGAV